jgi:ubiquinone/menaquinone biosynthesis C-methylase UbiE
MTGTEMPSEGVVGDSCKRSALRRQFALPMGFWGWVVGHLMAFKNAPMNRLALELLDVGQDDRILEIGFGPGAALAMLVERAPRGFVAGIDPSEVMVRQATKRNRRAVQAGRAEVRQGTAAQLPYSDRFFDKVLAVNSFHHWISPKHDLLEVRRVMRDGGVLLLALRMALAKPKMFAAPGLTSEQAEWVKTLVERAGFRDVRTVERDVGRRVTSILAKN